MSARNRVTKRAVLVGACAVLALGLGSVGVQAQSTHDRVMAEKKITVGIHNRAPWGFKSEDGTVTGFSPDLVRAAFAPLGVTEIDFVISEFGALIPGLVSRRIDAIASGLYINPTRCEAVAFSDPDLSLKDAVLVKTGNPHNIHSYKDIAANPELKFGVSRGSANAANAEAEGVPADRSLLLQDTEATVAALVGGRVDAISFSAPTVIGLLADKNLTGIERADPFVGLIKENGIEKSGYSAIAFRLEDADLRDVYNKRLAEMKADGTVAAIMAKYNFTEAEKAPNLTQAQICAGDS